MNLIGEHIDYNDLSVLPMAVDRDIRIRFRTLAEPTVKLSSTAPEFASFEFELTAGISKAETGDWSNYVRAAAAGLRDAGFELRRGFEGEVRGTIPVAAGMSSSSALLVATAKALLHVNNISVPPIELATLMASSERYVGVAGGGMDQAACVNGMEGHALRIDFAPLGFAAIPIPSGWSWIVASSMVRAEKSAGARDAYNKRTEQCREALQLVWGSLGDSLPGRQPSYRELRAKVATEELLRRGAKTLPPELERRFRHVITEAGRVSQASAALEGNDIRTFGRLMTDSHTSLRDDYEVSIEELDKLVKLATEGGAMGARLTGAGFGGCIVALVPTQRVATVLGVLERTYYSERVGTQAELSQVLFEVRAADGARVVPVT